MHRSHINRCFFVAVIVLSFAVVAFSKHVRLTGDGDWSSFFHAKILLQYVMSSKEAKNSYPNEVRIGYDSAPGYPLLIGTVAWFSPSYIDELSCYSSQRSQCPKNTLADAIILLQSIIAISVLLFVFLIALELSKSHEVAVLTLLIFLISGSLEEFSQLLRPYVIITALVLVSSYFSLLTYKKNSAFFAWLSGVFLGLAGLFHSPLVLAPLIVFPVVYYAMLNKCGHGLIVECGIHSWRCFCRNSLDSP